MYKEVDSWEGVSLRFKLMAPPIKMRRPSTKLDLLTLALHGPSTFDIIELV
jgi:hypothetical protein